MNINDLKKCNACDLTLNREDNFDRKAMDQFSFQAVCKECSKTIGSTNRKSPLRRRINMQVHNSHKRMLNNALNQKVEVTDPSKLREMYPEFTDLQITRMARLNKKINVANDFLIEEQHYYLNPSERPSGGIDYQAELFEERVFEDDNELSTIITEQIDIDDQ